jgi:hypothetical protein
MLRTAVTALAFGFLLPSLAQAAPAGQITHLSGILSASREDGTSKLLSVKSEVLKGDMLITENDTYARIKFSDGSEIVMRPGTQLKIDDYSYVSATPENDSVVMSILKGGLRAVTGLIGKRNRAKVIFQTATATIGIRGTHFGALLCRSDCNGIPTISGEPPPDGLHVDVTTGAIVLVNSAGSVQIDAGKFGFVATSTLLPVEVPPHKGIRVTMPNSISQNKDGGKGSDTECKL